MAKNSNRVSSYFGENVFDIEKMKQLLPQKTYQKVLNIIHKGEKLDRETANIIALAMKDWALTKGCTHYTHWFQPLTGFRSEEHTSEL